MSEFNILEEPWTMRRNAAFLLVVVGGILVCIYGLGSFIEPYVIADALKDIARNNPSDEWPYLFGEYLARSDTRARYVLVAIGAAIILGACMMRAQGRQAENVSSNSLGKGARRGSND